MAAAVNMQLLSTVIVSPPRPVGPPTARNATPRSGSPWGPHGCSGPHVVLSAASAASALLCRFRAAPSSASLTSLRWVPQREGEGGCESRRAAATRGVPGWARPQQECTTSSSCCLARHQALHPRHRPRHQGACAATCQKSCCCRCWRRSCSSCWRRSACPGPGSQPRPLQSPGRAAPAAARPATVEQPGANRGAG